MHANVHLFLLHHSSYGCEFQIKHILCMKYIYTFIFYYSINYNNATCTDTLVSEISQASVWQTLRDSHSQICCHLQSNSLSNGNKIAVFIVKTRGLFMHLLMNKQNIPNQYLSVIIYCTVTHIILLPLRIHMRCLLTELDGISHADTPAHLQHPEDNLTLIALAAG